MSISSLKQAFEVLESTNNRTPFEAIEYLYEHESCQEIEEKICYYLSIAFHYEQLERALYAPMWYAIVAENHLSEKLIDPIISIFTVENNNDDFLNEQCSFVLGRLSENYPDITVPKIIHTLQILIKKDSKAPYVYLFDGFYIKDIHKYKDDLLSILQALKNCYKIPLAMQIVKYGFQEALPILKKMLEEEKKEDSFFRMTADLEEAIELLEAGENGFYHESHIYHKTRADWKVHYRDFDKHLEKREEKYAQKSHHFGKIGRNDKCPCGSGKKYKKCCGKIG